MGHSAKISIGLILLAFTGYTAALKVTPCQVRNMLVQPQYGISANTKELIEIIQAPPLLTQTIQVGLCMQENYTFNGGPLSDLPDHICRQRYTSIEVYSKLNREKMDNLRSLRNILMLTQDEPQFSESFVKDFVLIESGCDIFFNYLPYLSSTSGMGGESYPRPVLGVSDINPLGGIEGHPQPPRAYRQQQFLHPPPSRNYDVLQASTDFKKSSLKTRSMIQDDFIRKGLHLKELKGEGSESQGNDNATIVEQPLPNQSTPKFTPDVVDEKIDLEDEGESEEHTTIVRRGKNIIDADGDLSIAKNFTIITTTDEFDDPEEESEESTETETETVPVLQMGAMQEHELKPENIGPPVLFLDPEFDPVMKLLSRKLN